MTPRYVDAEEAKKNVFGVLHCEYATPEEDMALSAIDDTPTADVAPVIHAAWLLAGVDHFWNKYIFVCSRCKRREKVSQRKDLKDFPYCHCGAKMYDPYADRREKIDEEAEK